MIDSKTTVKILAVSFLSRIFITLVHSSFIGYDIQPGHIYGETDGAFNIFIQNFFSYTIARLGLPFYEVMSGFFFFYSARKFSSYRQYYFPSIKRRFNTLIVTYVVWVTLWSIIIFILQKLPIPGVNNSLPTIFNMNPKELLHLYFVEPVPYHLWYLRDIFVFFLFAPVFLFLIKRTKIFFLLAILVLWIFVDDLKILRVKDLFFISTGAYLAIVQPQFKTPGKNVAWALIAVWIGLGFAKTLMFTNGNPGIAANLIYKASLIIGLYAIWYVFDHLPEKFVALFAKWGKYSFFVYLAHEYTQNIIRKIMFKVVGFSEPSYFLIYFTAPILTILLCSLVAMLLEKYIPPFYLLLTGKRNPKVVANKA